MSSAAPAPVRRGVDAALEARGHGGLAGLRPVSGGCINHGARAEAADGASFFLKWNARAPAGMFAAEADGLEALAAPGVLRVPRPLDRGGGEGEPAWLLMEWIEPGAPGPDHDAELGRGLARLHRAAAPEDGFGWDGDNWIGSLPQENAPAESWGVFWRDRRLLPQLEEARRRGHLRGAGGEALDRVLDATVPLLDGVDDPGPHLLHGDLWSGNAYADAEGRPVLVDPAVYRGHGEVDLAMTELFGGFGDAFYRAYDEVAPVAEAYRDHRRALYQLYYLLVHVSLFGSGYVGRTLEAARTVTRAA